MGRGALGLGLAAGLMLAAGPLAAGAASAAPRNLIIFVTDGLRYGSVTEAVAPGLAACAVRAWISPTATRSIRR